MRTRTTTLSISLLCISIAAAPLRSQTTGQKPTFEVASVKPYIQPRSGPPVFAGFRGQPGGRFTATKVTVKMLITYAYRVRGFQVEGGPDWAASDEWEVVAKAEENSISPQPSMFDLQTPDIVALMLQSLLEERFQLKLRRESREMSVYDLVVAKSGAKIQFSADQTPPTPPEPGSPPTGQHGMGTRFANGLFIMQATGVPLSAIIAALTTRLGRPIIDKTRLKPGFYDAQLQWAPDSSLGVTPLGPPGVDDPPPTAGSTSGPSIFTALEEQLGLRLVSSKGPVEVLVIDSVQKPTVD